MTETGARSLGDRRHGLTPAQWYCLLAGIALLLAGAFGFIADATFDTGASGADNDGGNNGGALQGDSFLGFEVNGWHNVIHLLSGVLLLSAFRRRTAAKTVALAFGVVYGVVTLIGLIDGNDVLGLIPVNAADNILHLALSLAGILASLVSPRDERLRTSTAPATAGTAGRSTDPLTGRPETGGTAGDQRFDRSLDPRDTNTRDAGEQPTNR